MKKILGLSLALLGSFSYMMGAGSFPIEIRNDRPDLTVKIDGGGLPSMMDFSDTAGGNLKLGHATIETVPQSDNQIVQRIYRMFISKKTGFNQEYKLEKPIEIKFFGAPAGGGNVYMFNEMVNTNAMIALVDGIRAYYPGWWGQGVAPQMQATYWLSDGTKVTVIIELVFESGWRKLKVYIK